MKSKDVTLNLLDKLDSLQQDQVLAYVQSLLQGAAKQELSAPPSQKLPFRFGTLKGKIHMREDFDEPMEEFQDYI